MKKKILNLMAIMIVGCMMTGCGKEEPTTESEEVIEATDPIETTLDIAKVTLGEYKGIEVSVAPVEVDEYSVNLMVANAYNGVVTAENGGITDRAVANGDTANINFIGKKDDVAFEGGTSYGYNLSIGSGQFIAGFEEGLVGVMPGETVDLNLTFPEDYGNEELKGAEVVFTVTVNYILPTEAEWQDSVVSTIGIEGVDTIQELRDYAYNYYYESATNTYKVRVENAVLTNFMDTCTFENIPRQYIEIYSNIAKNVMEQNAAKNGMSAESFCSAYYGMSLEEFIVQYSEEASKQEIVLREVAERENLMVTDEELESVLAENAAAEGFESVDEFLGQTPRETYRAYLICERALQFMVDNAVINNE